MDDVLILATHRFTKKAQLHASALQLLADAGVEIDCMPLGEREAAIKLLIECEIFIDDVVAQLGLTNTHPVK